MFSDENILKPSTTIQHGITKEECHSLKTQSDLNYDDIIEYNKKLSLMSQKLDQRANKSVSDYMACSNVEHFRTNDTSKVYTSNTNADNLIYNQEVYKSFDIKNLDKKQFMNNEKTPVGYFKNKKTGQQNFLKESRNNVDSSLNLFLNSLNSTGSLLNNTNKVDLSHFISLLPDSQEPDEEELFKIIMKVSRDKDKSHDADMTGINRVSFGAMCFNNIVDKAKENQKVENAFKNKARNIEISEEKKAKKLNLSVIDEDEISEKGQEKITESVAKSLKKSSVGGSSLDSKNTMKIVEKNFEDMAHTSNMNDHEKHLVDQTRLPSIYFKEDSHCDASYAGHARNRKKSNHDSLNSSDSGDENYYEYIDVEALKVATSLKTNFSQKSTSEESCPNNIFDKDKTGDGFNRKGPRNDADEDCVNKNFDEEKKFLESSHEHSEQNQKEKLFFDSLGKSNNIKQIHSETFKENKFDDLQQPRGNNSIKLTTSQKTNEQQQLYMKENSTDSSSKLRYYQLKSNIFHPTQNPKTQWSQTHHMDQQKYAHLHDLQPSYDVTMECSVLDALPVNQEKFTNMPVPLNDSFSFKGNFFA